MGGVNSFASCSRLCGSRQAVPGRGSCCGGRRVRRLRCGARSCGPSPNSLRSLRSATFKQAATSQSTNALRAGPNALRSSPPQKSPLPGTACRECNCPWSFLEKDGALPQRCVRAGWRAPLRRRGAQLWGRRACALQQLTRRVCLNAAPEGREVSYAARPQSEHHSAVGRTRSTAEAKPSGLPGRAFALSTAAGTIAKRAEVEVSK